MGTMMHIGTDIDETMMADLDRLAQSMDRSPKALVHDAIGRMVAEEAEMAAFIQPGIYSAETEGTLSQEEVEAWFASRRQQRAAAG